MFHPSIRFQSTHLLLIETVDYTSVDDYAKEFNRKREEVGAHAPVFSCNCILNYLYCGLEGKKIPPYCGPVTFGEIAYQLLNQTLVYCEILG